MAKRRPAKKRPGKIRRGASRVANSRGGRAFGEGFGYLGAFSTGLSHTLETSRASEIGQLNAGMTAQAARREKKAVIGVHRGRDKRSRRRNKYEKRAYVAGQIAPPVAILGGVAMATGLSMTGRAGSRTARTSRSVAHGTYRAASIQPGRSRYL